MFLGILGSYVLVAVFAAAGGWLLAHAVASRDLAEICSWPAGPALIDLAEPAPAYDWELDDELVRTWTR